MTAYTFGKRKKHVYDIKKNQGIYKNEEDRKELIIEIITKYPNIPQTHIIKLCGTIGRIPKIIVEELLERLKDQHTLKDYKDTSRKNGDRTWNIHSYDDDWQNDTMKNLDKLLENKEKILNMINTVSKDLIYFNAKKITYYIHILSFMIAGLKISENNMDDKQLKTKITKVEKLFETILHSINYEKNPRLYFYIINLFKKDMEDLLEEFNRFNKIKHKDHSSRKLGKLVAKTRNS